MTKLDADLSALHKTLSDDPALRHFAEVVQLARLALDEHAASAGEGYTSTGGFTETLTLPESLPVYLQVVIVAGLDEPAPDPLLARRADQVVEALERDFSAQIQLLRAVLDA
jgi:hypothetical protein